MTAHIIDERDILMKTVQGKAQDYQENDRIQVNGKWYTVTDRYWISDVDLCVCVYPADVSNRLTAMLDSLQSNGKRWA